MKLLRTGAIVAALAALLAMGTLIAALTASAKPDTEAAETFSDKTGDATPDITTLTVSHDAAGIVSLGVTIAGLGTPIAEGRRGVWVYLEPDDDTSPATPPYLLSMDESPASWGCLLLKWDGSSFRLPPSGQGSAACSRDGDVLTWRFAKADIGAYDLFSTFLVAWQQRPDGSVAGQDRAPDFGRWGYHFAAPATTTTAATTRPAPAVTPVIGKPAAIPARPNAGKTFTVTFPVSRSDTGARLKSGKMTCDPTIAGRRVAHSEQFTLGKARVTIRVPAGASGKTLKLRLTINSLHRSATRSVAWLVR